MSLRSVVTIKVNNLSNKVSFFPLAMSVNCSEECSSSPENMYTILQNCLKTKSGIINLSVVIATNAFVVVPLCALVIYTSVRRWLQCSGIAVSHSDHFAYQTIISDFLSLTGVLLSGCGAKAHHNLMMFVGLFLFCSTLFVTMFFDTLTCVERYLAVIHPIAYRNLKNAQGVRIRNVAIGCCWLLPFSVACFLFIDGEKVMAPVVLPVTVSTLTVVSFCSLCALSVLIRPGLGEVGQVKQQVDQTKLRAFYTILIILAVMLIRLGATVLISVLYTTLKLEESNKCGLTYPLFWINFPASLMTFVHFLKRDETMSICGKYK